MIVFLLSEDFELNSATDNTENWSFFQVGFPVDMSASVKRERAANSSAGESFAHGVGDVVLVRWSDDRI